MPSKLREIESKNNGNSIVTDSGSAAIGGDVTSSTIVTGNENMVVASGDVDVKNGDFVSRDKIVQNVQIDIEKLVELLKNNLPEGDPMPQHLRDVLNSFRFFHTSLHEWKELHNSLNDILVMLGPFRGEIQFLEFGRRNLNVALLSRLWKPVSMRTNSLLEWAKTIKQIGLPLVIQFDGIQGSRWSVEICVAHAKMESVFQSKRVDSTALVDSAGEFTSKLETHLYLADKQLRETADELYTLSQIVLGSRENG